MAPELFTDITGPENNPTIMFSHALGGDLSMWDRQVEALSRLYRMLRFDLRGHGHSPVVGSSLTIDDLGQDALALLDQYGIERVHFCGLSLGGLIGQWLGLHAPERLLSLTLVDTAPQMGAPEVWNQRFAQIEQGGMSAISGATMERWFTEDFRRKEPDTVARIRSILEATPPAGYIACAKVVRDTSIPFEDLKRIAAPALVVTGTFDLAAKPDESRRMASQMPMGRFLELNAAHISPVEASKDFNDGLRAFLNEHRT